MSGESPTPDRVRRTLAEAYRAAVEAVDPATVVEAKLSEISLDRSRARIVAIGKAAPAMCRGAAAALGSRLIGGVAVSDHVEPVPPGIRLLVGSHPYPDDRSLAGGEAVLREAASTGEDEVLVVLVSGGGSALVERLPEGMDLGEAATTQRVLLNSGVPIEEINTVRRHLSLVKNGGVVRASGTPRVVSLLVSDVIDGPAAAIASGPTLEDGSSPADALAVLERWGLRDRIPSGVLRHLETSRLAPPGDVEHTWHVVADVSVAAAAAHRAIERMGLPASIVTTALRGEAREQALRLLEGEPGVVRIAAGETTVTVRGEGTGGRSQEGALAAAMALEGTGGVFAALGTDGIDGPTDAAGAIVDGGTTSRIRAAGLDPRVCLDENDSHPALDASGDLVRTGPSGTNVGDVWMAWRHPSGGPA